MPSYKEDLLFTQAGYNVGSAVAPPNVFSQNLNTTGATSGTTVVVASAVASGTLTLPAATDTLVGKATTDTLTNKTLTSPTITGTDSGAATLSNKTLSSPIINGSPTGTGIPTLTLKKGTGLGNYTGANTTYNTDVDVTNLAFTVTIPTGWKLWVVATASAFPSTGAAELRIALFDTQGSAIIPGSESATNPTLNLTGSLTSQGLITGDGLSHTIKLRALTNNGSNGYNIFNNSSTNTPTMVFTLSPSN